MTVQAIRAINLLRRALKKAEVPLYWDKYSPKKFSTHQHTILLVFRRKIRGSYVDFTEFWLPIMTQVCATIGLVSIPEQSTLCREEHRLRPFLEMASIRLIQAVLPERPFATGDGTGLSFTGRSSYYVRRILGQRGSKRRGFARLVVVNTTKNLILGAGIRLLPIGELSLLRKIWPGLARKPSTLVWDKAGDSEKLHKWLEHDENVRSIAPVRAGAVKGFFRLKLKGRFPEKTYHKRNHSETTIRLYKQSFGENLKAKSLKGRRAEIACNVLTHNLNQRLKKFCMIIFSMAPSRRNL